jgi:hypothetical protein
MKVPRLTTSMWVSALIRRLQSNGVYATVLAKGDKTGGSVILASRARDGSIRTFVRTASLDDTVTWLETSKVPLTESDSLAAMRLARKRDPDLWWVEVELDDMTPYVEGMLANTHKA